MNLTEHINKYQMSQNETEWFKERVAIMVEMGEVDEQKAIDICIKKILNRRMKL